MMWLILSLTSAAITSAAIWSRFPTRARPLSVVAFLASLPVSWAILAGSAGWSATPYPYLSPLPHDAALLGFSFQQDVAIYVMLDVDGEPRLYRLPWSNEKASQIQRMAEGGGNGSIKGGGGGSDDYEVHEEVQPPAPEKQPAAPGLEYQRQP